MEAAEYDKMFAVEDRHFWFRGKRAWIAALLRRHMGERIGGGILDVGCGTGANLLFLSGWGEALGIDQNAAALAYCRQRGLGERVSAGSAHALPFPDARFSLVCALDVLYHRDLEPARALREMSRVLKPGGHLLITDSAMPFLAGPHDRAVWARERFTRRSLRALVEAAGFEVRQLSYANFFLFPLVFAMRLAGRVLRGDRSGVGTRLPVGNGALYAVLRCEAALLGAGIRLPWGSSIVCLAQRHR